MNGYERVKTALAHQEADRLPVCPIFGGVTRRLVGANYAQWSQDADVCASAFIKASEDYEVDALITMMDFSIEADAWGQVVLFPEDETARPDYTQSVVQDIEEYDKIQKVDFRQSKRMQMHIDVCKKLVEAKKGQVYLVAFVISPLAVLSMLRGQQDLYMDLYDDPDIITAAVGRMTETIKEYVAALCATGVDAVMIDTLMASATIMAKDQWREIEAQALGELADVIRAQGCTPMLHNCGKNVYFDAMIEAAEPAAISFLYPPDGCVDFATAKEKYGDKITLIGAVTPANAVLGTDEVWDTECKEQIAAMAKGGGYILATGCEYAANAGFEKAQRMIDIAKNEGRYS